MCFIVCIEISQSAWYYKRCWSFDLLRLSLLHPGRRWSCARNRTLLLLYAVSGSNYPHQRTDIHIQENSQGECCSVHKHSSLTSYLCLLRLSQWSYLIASRLCSHSHSSFAFSLTNTNQKPNIQWGIFCSNWRKIHVASYKWKKIVYPYFNP